MNAREACSGFVNSRILASLPHRSAPAMQDVVARLNAAVREALADPDLCKRFAELGQEVPPPGHSGVVVNGRVPARGEHKDISPVILSASVARCTSYTDVPAAWI